MCHSFHIFDSTQLLRHSVYPSFHLHYILWSNNNTHFVVGSDYDYLEHDIPFFIVVILLPRNFIICEKSIHITKGEINIVDQNK